MALSPKVFGERVRELRLGRGMRQSDLADVTGLNRTHINRIENGTANYVQLDTLAVLAQGLRVSLSELFEGIQLEDIYTTRKLRLSPR